MSKTFNPNPLTKEIFSSTSAHIVGFFLGSENSEYIEQDIRQTALGAAERLIKGHDTDSADKSYLQRVLNCIADDDGDDLHDDVKEFLMSRADDSELAKIALDDDEDSDVRIKAVRKMTDPDKLLDIAADSEDDDVRQAAKNRIKAFR